MLLFRTAQTGIFAAQLLLAMFFVFVGGMKSAAPMAMLQLHHAWVASLPTPVARLVGASESVCASLMILGLLLRRAAWFSGVAALALVANQAAAVIFHIMRGELAGSGPQNLLIVLALSCVGAWQCFGARHVHLAAEKKPPEPG